MMTALYLALEKTAASGMHPLPLLSLARQVRIAINREINVALIEPVWHSIAQQDK